MKKKVLFSIIIAMILSIIAVPTLKAANLDGINYNAAYGLDFHMADGWVGQNKYGPNRDYGCNMALRNPSMPYPFDVKFGQGKASPYSIMFILALSDRAGTLSTSYATGFVGGYCVGWGVPFGEYEPSNSIGSTQMQSYNYSDLIRDRDGHHLDDLSIRQIKYVLTYAYSYPVVPASQVVNGPYVENMFHAIHYYGNGIVNGDHPKIAATQLLCWVAANHYLEDDNAVSTLDPYFFNSDNGSSKRDNVNGLFYEYRNKAVAAMKMPSYSHNNDTAAIANKIELKWNATNQRFEARVQDSNRMNVQERVSIQYRDYNQNLHFEQNGDGSVTIWTTAVVGDINNPHVLTVRKSIQGAKGVLVFAKSQNNTSQPIAIPQPGSIEEDARIAVYTQAIKVRGEKTLNAVTANGINAYGDAYTKDCEYTIYRDEACTDTVETITVQSDNLTNKSSYLPYQRYWVKETKANESTKLNSKVYLVDPDTFELDADGDIVVNLKFDDDIKESGLRLIKFWEQKTSEKCPAEGAEFILTLVNNESETYTTHIDAEGRATFENIPWGTYRLTESDSNSEKYLEVPDKEYELKEDDEVETVKLLIIGDNWAKTNLRIVKIDETLKETIAIANTQFKIYDVDEDEWVSQSTLNGFIDVFSTNDNGELITPEPLYAGTYRIYEVKAPKGYYLDPKMTIPQDSSKLLENGFEVELTKDVEVEEIAEGIYAHVCKIPNDDTRVSLKIYKTGERLANSKTESVKYETTEGVFESVTKTIPLYKKDVPLQGVEFKIYANKDIKTPDGRFTYHKEGDLITTIVTQENGYATANNLHKGEYRIVETAAPAGYLITDEEGNPKEFTMTMEDSEETIRMQDYYKEVSDERQKLAVEFKKVFEDYEYTNGTEERHAVFGLYAKEPILNYEGNTTIDTGDLVDIIEVDGDSVKESQADLPEGKYYLKELYASFPYSISDKEVDVNLEYDGNKLKALFKVTDPIVNTPVGATVTFVKIAKSTDDNMILNGSVIETSSNLDEKAQNALNEIKELSIDGLKSHYEQLKEYYEENNIKVVSGAVYEIWLNAEGTEKLYKYAPKVEDRVVATFTTDESGIIEITGIPRGEYYLKEISAPAGYEIQNETVKFIISDDSTVTKLYQAIYDDDSVGAFITKKDIFTGDLVPHCEFEITDSNGHVIVKSITDEFGIAYITTNAFTDGQTYYYQEISAPEIYNKDGKLYELNTEKHEFVAHVDQQTKKWTGEPIEVVNIRPLTDVELIKTDDEGNRVPNCKFELKSVEDGLFYETGVTDENGVYVFKNVPKGEYTYTELEAPEEYELDTNPHEIFVEGDRMVIEFPNTLKTGDINVVLLTIIALVSVVGISYITVKKINLSKNA